jgi:hypothetical protein
LKDRSWFLNEGLIAKQRILSVNYLNMLTRNQTIYQVKVTAINKLSHAVITSLRYIQILQEDSWHQRVIQYCELCVTSETTSHGLEKLNSKPVLITKLYY